MGGVKMVLIFAAALCIASVMSTVSTGTYPSMEHLVKEMNKVIAENANLKTDLQLLKSENLYLSSELNKTNVKKDGFEKDSLTCEAKLNKTIEDMGKCLSTQSECVKSKAVMTSNLDRCETTKKSLENNEIIQHHVLNASKTAHNQCLGQLAICKEVKSKTGMDLQQCRTERKSLESYKIIHENVLNASKSAHDQCLVQLADMKTQLGQCMQKGPVFPRSCQEWKDAGYTQNGDYMVDPDGPGGVDRFQVECEMDSHRGVPVTVMHHDTEARLRAGDAGATATRNVVYKATLPQIVAIIKISGNCEQYIKYECHSRMLRAYNAAYWFSRDGVAMNYWGGALPGSGKCACGMTNSCDKPGKVCNCDANDQQWRSDSGILTDRNTLPVTKMYYGDYGHSYEHGYHRLGALRCYG